MSSVPAMSGVAVRVRSAWPFCEVEVAGEDGLAVLDDVHIGRAAGAGGEDFELDAVARLDDGAIGAEENLVGAVAGLRGDCAGGAVAVMVVGFDLEGFAPAPVLKWMTATPPGSVETCWIVITGEMDVRWRAAGVPSG